VWGNFVITAASGPPPIVATDKETGKVVWESAFADTPEVVLTSAPLAIKDKIIVGAANGDQGVRESVAGLDAATGRRLWQKHTIPAPGEPGSETWKDKNNAWQTGGGAVWVTGTYDPEINQTVWGTMWDYDEVGTHIMIDGYIGGEPRNLITHSARNGFFYTMERANGAMVSAKPYMDKINWTKGINQKTGKPLDYDSNEDIQTYSTPANQNPSQPTKQCVRRSLATITTGRLLTVHRPSGRIPRR
jgi:alcohol dehydrogenase (cytochrome c)